MNQKGFGLIIMIIVVTVIILLAGGRLYFSSGNSNQKSLLETGNEAIQQAEDVKKMLEDRDKQIKY